MESQLDTLVEMLVLLLKAIHHAPALKEVSINKSKKRRFVKLEITDEFIVREADVAALELVKAALAELLIG